MNTSQEGISLIKKFEGCPENNGICYSYLCPADVWTIGYGSIKGVKEGDAITKAEAEKLLIHELEEYEGYVNKFVEQPLDQNQFDALVAWTFNLGPSNLRSSTMLQVLNEGKFHEVPQQMRRWNKANGKVLEGLERRRLAESMLFDGDPSWHEV